MGYTLADEGAFEISHLPSGECSVAVLYGVPGVPGAPGVPGGPFVADERVVLAPGEWRELHLTLRRR